MSSERERREFQAGLAEEVDAWLRGDKSRRTFLQRLVELGGATALARPGSRAARDEPWRERGAGGGRARRSEHAVRPGPGRRGQGVDRRSARELGVSRRRGSEAIRRLDHQHDLRVGPAGARAPQLLRTAVAGPDRHRLQRRGAAAPGPVFQADRRAHRRLRRLRHPRHRAGLDSVDGERRRHPADRRLRRAVYGQGRPRGLSPPVPVPADLQGQALGLLRRRRRVRALLPHRHLRRPQAAAGVQGQVQFRDLRVPQTWDEYAQVAQFITDQLAPNVYGGAHFRKAGNPGNQFSFLQQYRANGGRFFDERR